MHGLVVIHDDDLNINVEGANRATRELGRVSEKTLAEVRRYNVGQNESIPTVREVLDFFVETNAERAKTGMNPLIVNMELNKSRDISWPVAHMIREYVDTQKLSAKHIVFCSFDHGQLLTLKKENPDFQIAPCLKTKFLFGKDNVDENYKVKDGTPYREKSLAYLRKFCREHECAALDPVLWDICKPLIDIARENKVAIHASTSDQRTYETAHLIRLNTFAREVPVFFKTDEPGQFRTDMNKQLAAYERDVNRRMVASISPLVEVAALAENPLEKPEPFSLLWIKNALIGRFKNLNQMIRESGYFSSGQETRGALIPVQAETVSAPPSEALNGAPLSATSDMTHRSEWEAAEVSRKNARKNETSRHR